jgi:GntR family transcriptional regulator
MAAPHFIEIDLASTVPAYRQIVDHIRSLLVSGELLPGASLASVRRLAADLGVHHNTVAEAYRTLAEEGWLVIEQGKAARVVSREAGPALKRPEQEAVAQSFERRLRNLIAETRMRGLSTVAVARSLRLLAQEVE